MTAGTTPASAEPRASAGLSTQALAERPAGAFAIGGWVMLEWAAQPFYALINTFLFAPYFVNVFVGDGVKGQAIWGYTAAAAGLGIAIVTPVVGAIADTGSRRKPLIAIVTVIMAAAMAALWLAIPGDAGRLWPVMAAFVVAAIAGEVLTMLGNAVMAALVPPSRLGRLSGLGYAVGYLGGLISLLVMIGLIVTGPDGGKTLLGLKPIIALDAAAHEGDRLAGPFAAAWLVVFMLPFFLFTPDRRRVSERAAAPASAVAKSSGLGAALARFGHTLAMLPRHGNILRFLIARMLFQDGMSAIFAFGGIYGASIFGWQAFEQGLFGIVLIVVGVIGALIGGLLDDWTGPTPVIVIALIIVCLAAIGIVSIDRTHMLFFLDVPVKVAGAPPFSSTGERVFLLFAVFIGFVSAPIGAASRSLLARLAPPDQVAQFFGLFAFSGKITAFLAPLAVAAVTAVSGSQRAGIAAILIFLVVGLIMMLWVRTTPERAVE